MIQRSKTINDLSARVRTVLWRMKLQRRDEIKRAIRNRTLHPNSIAALGFGWKGLREVRGWLGMKPDITGKQIHYYRSAFAAHLNASGLSWREISRVMRFSGPGEAQAMVASANRRGLKIPS